MRLLISGTFLALGMACVTKPPGPVKTQVVTFPEGALVEYNGKPVGRAPAAVILPQDSNGRLTERSVLSAVPNSAQKTLYAQSRVLDPATRGERIPNQVLIDLTLRDTNVVSSVPIETTHTESASATNKPFRSRTLDRGKPTQPVGLDRWNPGIY